MKLRKSISARAMRLQSPRTPLVCKELRLAPLTAHELLIEVAACGVCRTDLHLVDGDLPAARFPVTPGHEIVGFVAARGSEATQFALGERVGVPWLGRSCGRCRYCLSGAENLCDTPAFTGCNLDGGYATHAVADARFCLRIPTHYSDAEAAPLLCAGLIGYRAFRACGEAETIGLYGFGAAAHLLGQVAKADGRNVFAFTRPGDLQGQEFARELGVEWAGASGDVPPRAIDAAIIFAPVGALVPVALANVRKGGRVVCAGIHMSEIPAFPYHLLWGERSISSIANLTRADGYDFMRVAARERLSPTVECFALEQANLALARLRSGELRGAAVLKMNPEEASG
jgi:propanol-preferring alcohol dehydrogenase